CATARTRRRTRPTRSTPCWRWAGSPTRRRRADSGQPAGWCGASRTTASTTRTRPRSAWRTRAARRSPEPRSSSRAIRPHTGPFPSHSDRVRVERLLRILLMLQSRDRVTVGELAGRLGVARRTIQRDLDAMSLAGVPVYSTRGRNGGWSLLPDFRSRWFGLTPAEAMSIFVGTAAQVLSDLGLAATDQAYPKLLTALPQGIRRDADFALQRVLIDRPGWDEEITDGLTWLPVCRQGLWEERLMILRYGR